MECLHKPSSSGATNIPAAHYDREKIIKIRRKIVEVFGSASTWDDGKISERYNITSEGDLIMIVK